MQKLNKTYKQLKRSLTIQQTILNAPFEYKPRFTVRQIYYPLTVSEYDVSVPEWSGFQFCLPSRYRSNSMNSGFS
jgi:hypothetical protein